MPTPTSTDLIDYTGTPVSAAQATAVIGVVKAMVSAHTRGAGFTDGEPNAELSAVILSASARLLINTSGVVREQMGALEVQYGSAAFGFTLPELGILDRYRMKAM
ncbi:MULTISPECIES: hypothetical protein [unclassified Mycolicibacterium]|uniref:hypothetical protein n=1 Tax=unclassified Mycolicibacterium TaxID=2636767 RepID=UPI0012DD513A|nr:MULTISPECIES: hypothetical protein [unclassified Mycolicibacterium]MUL80508.1 hypothetical protein [Mycolicibacterium sp. CBMA 329]MUL86275.1 hypothetical protein [Mycolicibacterium sp. CBMA 331]MUM01063.1 hypothetical protein [Mycolicibacterium sp. CBMA 334]MUM24957.1 hypothetical protein [Mycolicibacterium sp. CBMA 295]MUM36571.1 hypothetical protein [Mycolicibacterium sp. CBMA 247]